MMNQLRGRNLAHVGCTVGLVLGLLLGMIAGILIISLVHAVDAANWAALVWIGLTFVLGLVGFVVGGRVSGHLWGEDTEG
jgi:ABC-type uncharacterized transport system YnjBCD permease subunit